MKYRKKPVVIDATQWFKNGDHPEDGTERFADGEFKGELYEGKVVRYYRTPDLDGQNKCRRCKRLMHDHGWIDTLEVGHIVCPGDWVITGVQGEHYPCKPAIFDATYELVERQCAHELTLTGMYEPFSVGCKICGALHFGGDEYDAQQAKLSGPRP